MGDQANRLTAATPRVAAGVLFRDGGGDVLLVRPTYKPHWDLPGGYVEPGESPRAAARREVREELALEIDPRRLLSVDWAPHDDEGDKLLFIFDGGVLAETQRAVIRHPDGEISECKFVCREDIDRLTIPRLARRIHSTLDAPAGQHLAYLEHGAPITR